MLVTAGHIHVAHYGVCVVVQYVCVSCRQIPGTRGLLWGTMYATERYIHSTRSRPCKLVPSTALGGRKVFPRLVFRVAADILRVRPRFVAPVAVEFTISPGRSTTAIVLSPSEPRTCRTQPYAPFVS